MLNIILLSFLQLMSKEESQFSEPEGIDVDSNGRVYVADTGNSRVQSFDLSNTNQL